MKIGFFFDKIWSTILLISIIVGFTFLCYVFYLSFLKFGISFFSSNMFFGFMTIVLIGFTFLLEIYIHRTKKDIEILEIMEQQRKRTDGYTEQIIFMENAGPIGTGYIYLDHGGFFLLPFIQKRKNYRDIDVKKIPFKKKFPFILFFICMFSIPILGFIAWWI